MRDHARSNHRGIARVLLPARRNPDCPKVVRGGANRLSLPDFAKWTRNAPRWFISLAANAGHKFGARIICRRSSAAISRRPATEPSSVGALRRSGEVQQMLSNDASIRRGNGVPNQFANLVDIVGSETIVFLKTLQERWPLVAEIV